MVMFDGFVGPSLFSHVDQSPSSGSNIQFDALGLANTTCTPV